MYCQYSLPAVSTASIAYPLRTRRSTVDALVVAIRLCYCLEFAPSLRIDLPHLVTTHLNGFNVACLVKVNSKCMKYMVRVSKRFVAVRWLSAFAMRRRVGGGGACTDTQPNVHGHNFKGLITGRTPTPLINEAKH
jgi:hypothetical protein